MKTQNGCKQSKQCMDRVFCSHSFSYFKTSSISTYFASCTTISLCYRKCPRVSPAKYIQYQKPSDAQVNVGRCWVILATIKQKQNKKNPTRSFHLAGQQNTFTILLQVCQTFISGFYHLHFPDPLAT